MKFCKYEGCGNDFIVIDNRENFFLDYAKVPALCHRQKGIGADGVLLLENSKIADFKMRIFNSDGTEAEMCGNGIRCLFQFINDRIRKAERLSIEAHSSTLLLSKDGVFVKVGMPTPCKVDWLKEINLDGRLYGPAYLEVGVPHAVLLVESISETDMTQIAPRIRRHPGFLPKGVNVNFVQRQNEGILVRTFERGVEQETLACGTGATAAAIAASKFWGLSSPINVETLSGDSVIIAFEWSEAGPMNVFMSGPAKFVFDGFLSKN